MARPRTLGILLAGGRGERLGAGVPKALATLEGRTLLARGLGKRSNIAILSTNTPHYAVMHFGAARGGAVLTHFSYRMTPQEMATLTRNIGVTALFVDPLLTELARSVLSLVPEIRTVVSLGGATEDAEPRPGERLSVDAFVGLPDGSEWIRDRVEAEAGEPGLAGAQLAERLIGAGAREILDRAEAVA